MHDDRLGVLGILEDSIGSPKVLLLGDLRVDLQNLVVVHLEKFPREHLKLLLVDKLREIARCLLRIRSFVHDAIVFVNIRI